MGPCWEEGQIKGCSDLSHFPLPPPVCWRESRRRGQRQVESAVLMGWVCADHPLSLVCRVTP